MTTSFLQYLDTNMTSFSIPCFRWISMICLVLGYNSVFWAAQADRFNVVREKVLSFDMTSQAVGPYRSAPYAEKTGVVWRQRVGHSAAVTAIRVHVSVPRAATPAKWKLLFKDLSGRQIDILTPEILLEPEFWSDEIPGRAAILELQSDSDPTGLEIVVDRYAYRELKSFPQAITGHDDRQPIWSTSVPLEVRGWGQAVARLRFMTTDGRQASCTAFLVSSTLLFTNEHCIHSNAESATAVADFGYDEYSSLAEHVRLRKLELNDSGLDYALVRLNVPVATKYGKLRIQAVNDLPNRFDLVIIQHPAGEPKQVSIIDCQTSGAHRRGAGDLNTDFGHLCDTLGGSSGSPVIDINRGLVVGLHHLGFREASPDPVNQAVYFGLILDDIQRRDAGLFAEIMQP